MYRYIAKVDNGSESQMDPRHDKRSPGHGIGRISPRLFEVATWSRHMESAVGMRQYGKFVETMLYRICAEESDPDEFRAFVDLIATDVNRKFLEVALRHLPDLCEEQ